MAQSANGMVMDIRGVTPAMRRPLVFAVVDRMLDIGFKGGAIYEILNNIASDEVTIQLADPSRAGVVVPTVQPEGQEILMLIMPMLLND